MSRRVGDKSSSVGDAEPHETNAIVVVEHGRDGMPNMLVQMACSRLGCATSKRLPMLPTPVIVYILEYSNIVGTREIFPLFDRSINSYFRPPYYVQPKFIGYLAVIHSYYYKRLRRFFDLYTIVELQHDVPWWRLAPYASPHQILMIQQSFMEIYNNIQIYTYAETQFFQRLVNFLGGSEGGGPTMESTLIPGMSFIAEFYMKLDSITVWPYVDTMYLFRRNCLHVEGEEACNSDELVVSHLKDEYMIHDVHNDNDIFALMETNAQVAEF